ncbi:MAG: hypothetical protein KAJ03_07365 [Gammaproteobacteria bacterium]|nr:hypothetical protein [Gammaproteobacteria bacterium]
MIDEISMIAATGISCVLIALSIGLFSVAWDDGKRFRGLDEYDQSRGGMGIIWFGVLETLIGVGLGITGLLLIYGVLTQLGS